MAGIPFWGIKCKGCGETHPTGMHRTGDTFGRFKPEEKFGYKCPRDDKLYEYLGRDEQVYSLIDSSGAHQT